MTGLKLIIKHSCASDKYTESTAGMIVVMKGYGAELYFVAGTSGDSSVIELVWYLS